MTIEFLGHACFRIGTECGSVVLDPFADGSVAGLNDVRAEAELVLVSHDHFDHSARENVTLTGRPCGIAAEAFASFHDDAGGAKRGPNTVHILSAEGKRVAHLGDLGHMPDEALIAALKGVDAMLIPIGGFFTIDAETACEIVRLTQPKAVIPMHYRGAGFGFDVLGTAEAFTDRFPDVLPWGSRLELTDETRGVYVMRPALIREEA